MWRNFIMKIEVNLTEKEIKETVLQVIRDKYYKTYSEDRRHIDRIIAECVRQVIYADKDRIVDRIVEQASRECKNKALKKILASLDE